VIVVGVKLLEQRFAYYFRPHSNTWLTVDKPLDHIVDPRTSNIIVLPDDVVQLRLLLCDDSEYHSIERHFELVDFLRDKGMYAFIGGLVYKIEETPDIVQTAKEEPDTIFANPDRWHTFAEAYSQTLDEWRNNTKFLALFNKYENNPIKQYPAYTELFIYTDPDMLRAAYPYVKIISKAELKKREESSKAFRKALFNGDFGTLTRQTERIINDVSDQLGVPEDKKAEAAKELAGALLTHMHVDTGEDPKKN